VLHDASLIAERMVHLALHGTIEAIDGSLIAIDAQSLCVHGDSADAVAIAREVRRRLEAAGVGIAAFSTLRGVSPRA
jgi:UPF0271 protein